MALFKFRSRQVADMAAQRNFEQLEGMFPLAGKDIADGTITSLQIADGTIVSADIADGTIALVDLSTAVLNNFLKLAVGANRKANFGINNVTWPGGSPIAAGTFAHGLGVAPVVVLVTASTGGETSVFAAHAGGYTSTSFDVQGEYISAFAPAAGATKTVAWLAVG